MVEGTILAGSQRPSVFGEPSNGVNTAPMLFIFAGNFPQIRHERTSRNKPSVGFTDTKDRTNCRQTDLHQQLEDGGMVTQLVGRISRIAELEALSRTALKEILKTQILPDFQSTWKFMGKNLKVSNYMINKIVDNAYEKGIGARGLRAGLDEHLETELFNLKF